MTRSAVLKDLNFIEIQRAMQGGDSLINFSVADRRKLIKNLKKDTQFLKKKKLIDYSLLIGIEKVK